MNLRHSFALGLYPKSVPQQVRKISEAWFGSEGYCLACPSNRLQATKPNTIVEDFVCPKCDQSYELKSGQNKFGKRVIDGAYLTMLRRVRSARPPALILLQYKSNTNSSIVTWDIERLLAVHPIFLTENVIEPRTPLSSTARRAGWQGCSIRIDRIPADGLIDLIQGDKPIIANDVRAQFNSSKRFEVLDQKKRAWPAMVLALVHQFDNPVFTLESLYRQRSQLQDAFPHNNHIEAKIRQQLQVLRDLGYIDFLGKGNYRLLSSPSSEPVGQLMARCRAPL